MPYFKSPEGTTLHYKDRGKGPTIVFVHGNNVDSQFWSYQIAVLSENGVRTIAPDRRGHGRSEYVANGQDYDTYASDLAALIEFADLRGVTLVGHSTGANAIARYIARYGAQRVAGAVLVAMVNPNPFSPDDAAAIEATNQIIDATLNDRPQYFDSLKEAFFGPSVSEVMMNAILGHCYTIPLDVALDTVRIFLDPRSDIREDLRALTIPTLIVHGDADTFSPFEQSGKVAHDVIDGSRVLLYEGASHGLTISEQGRFTSDLLAFVESTSAVAH
ncbi:MAG TPA: alpha/beta hydrolase [Candidatus Aquilonibacter sp.]